MVKCGHVGMWACSLGLIWLGFRVRDKVRVGVIRYDIRYAVSTVRPEADSLICRAVRHCITVTVIFTVNYCAAMLPVSYCEFHSNTDAAVSCFTVI